MSTGPSAAPAAQPWNSPLPTEILGRIFGQLDEKPRCRAIPFVNKEFHRAHNAYPPQPTHLRLRPDASASLVSYFQKAGSSLEVLDVVEPRMRFHRSRNVEQRPSIVARMLTVLAESAPNLHTVKIDYQTDDSEAILDSLAGLSQIKSLELQWGLTDFGKLSGLKSLQSMEIHFRKLSASELSEPAESLMGALGSLTGLTALTCGDFWTELGNEDDHHWRIPSFLKHVTRLVQLRSLNVYDIDRCVDKNGMLPKGLSALTKLTQLSFFCTHMEMGGCSVLPASAFHSSIRLPSLIQLSLHLEGSAGIAHLLTSPHLTSISIEGHSAQSVSEILPPSAPCLPSLLKLSLAGPMFSEPAKGLRDFPASVASRLTSLTSLALPENSFQRFPTTLSLLCSLESLDMARNLDLQFQPRDVDTLAALSRLRLVMVHKEDTEGPLGSWSSRSDSVFASFRARLPSLELSIGEDYGEDYGDYE